MTTIREAYLAFSDYSERQKKTVQSIQSEIRESRAQIGETVKALEKQVAALYPSYESFPVEELTAAAEDAGLPHNFTLRLSSLLRHNNDTQQKRLDIISQYGSRKALADTRKALSCDSLEKEERLTGLKTVLSDMMGQELYNVVMCIDRRCGSYRATDEQIKSSIDYYDTASFGRFFFRDWREGREVIKEYREKVGDPEAALKTRRDNFKEQDVLKHGISTATDQIVRINNITDRMDELEREFLPDKKIAAVLHEYLVDALFDEKFLDALGARLGKDVAEPLAESVLKFLNLTKIEQNLASVLDVAEGTQKKIDKPLRQFESADPRASNKTVGVDLEKIDAALAAQRQYVGNVADSSRKMRNSIAHTPSSAYAMPSSHPAYTGSDSSTSFMNWSMFMHILNHSGADSTCVNQVLGDFDVSKTSFGTFDVPSTSAPEQNGTLNSIANESFSMPDVPNISVPEVSVPSIYVPGASSSGPSYTYDGGGGYSSSSDSGGGGGGYSSGGDGGGGCGGGGGGF